MSRPHEGFVEPPGILVSLPPSEFQIGEAVEIREGFHSTFLYDMPRLAQVALSQSVAINHEQLHAFPIEAAKLPLSAPRLRIVGCCFGNPPRPPLPLSKSPPVAPRKPSSQSPSHERARTRLRPSRDVVKLADRLRLLLEPPLEALFAASQLSFPRCPFAYQWEGVAFLYPRHEAVLADEMGLGKTMQAITAVRLLVSQGQLRRVLLICPKPLVGNWTKEFADWAPELAVSVIEGSRERRLRLWRQAESPVVIANYEVLVRDRPVALDNGNPFDLVIIDEAQRIKNSASVTSDAVRSVSRSRSWALTGTPIENSIEDLVGIFSFVSPGQVSSGMRPQAVASAVSGYVLRRTKEQVLTELPPMFVRDTEIELTPEQAVAYQLAENQGVVRLRAMKQSVTIQHVFELILRLKQICNFDPTTRNSSKLERLEVDLHECAASGRKAIVFSQWVQTLVELRSRLAQFNPAEYHGQIPQRRRELEIERFRDDPNCHLLLMSYGAGSVGLNLQFASYVFLFDRWWNPAVEDQAINRAHRIGAKHPVMVTRFLAAGTIEQRINAILQRKRELFSEVFRDAVAAPCRGLTRDEVFSLFQLQVPANRSDQAA